MARKKKLIILIVILALCVAGVSAVSLLGSENGADEDLVISDRESAAVQAIKWVYNGTETEIRKNDSGKWYYSADEAFPLDQEIALEMALAVSDINAVKVVSEEPGELDKYGINDPQIRIYVTYDDAEIEYDVGNYNEVSGYYYLMCTGSSVLYYADSSLYSMFAVDIFDLTEYEFLPEIEMTDVSSFALVNSGKQVSVSYASDSEQYLIADSNEVCDTETVQNLINSFVNISWNSCVAYNAKDLAPYGLDAPTADFSIKYSYTVESEDETGSENIMEGHDALLIGKSFTEDEITCYYAMIKGGKCVYTITEDVAQLYFITGEESLYSKSLLDFDVTAMESLTVTFRDKQYVITAETDDQGNTVYLLDGEEKALETFVSAVASLEAESVQSSDIDDVAAELISFAVKCSDTEKTMTIYEFDDTLCAVELGGQLRYFTSESDCDDICDEFRDVLTAE